MRVAGLLLILCSFLAPADAHHDRRIVDRVVVGDLESERDHGYDGRMVESGVAAGRPYREARGWIRYSLAVFDDTEVTVALTLANPDALPRRFDLFVENQLVGSQCFPGGTTFPTVMELRVPVAITHGRANLLVMLRATSGFTPALMEVRTVQDHNE